MTEHRPLDPPASTTIATIAHDVGVSVATVSKVLNGHEDVAAGTRARVEESLDRHRYQRRARRSSSAGRIDLVFHEFDTGWAMEVLRGAEAVTSIAGIGLAVSQLDGAHRPPQRWLDTLLSQRPLGVLLVLCHLAETQQQQLRRQGVPFVVIDTDSATSASVPTVGSNNWNGGLLAARHLLELGHRRNAVISGPPDVLCSRARAAGFQHAHEEIGLTVDRELVRYGSFSAGAGHAHGLELLRRPDRPTAIFAGSDTQAMGVLRAARQCGLRVPEDLSVIGYDNLPVATWTYPALTTINQPLRDMAGIATQMLLDLIAGNGPATSRIDLVTELVVRESTAPPAQQP
ncbi:LacI family DNA-binding transcriptional regulator [Micromonospora sp. MH99]|uniref:LacI family DNA-binding transcriptional regulator n=1 Tax=Micromonospora sp. MH99 TaxID=1945510 RepID=UPI001F470C74|nr:substrate-binding domain-containing protein [Micromonospora sp. MH99]MCF0093796.1 HTH-type transcriptional repressor PurR [Micromonospora sp. MH99]